MSQLEDVIDLIAKIEVTANKVEETEKQLDIKQDERLKKLERKFLNFEKKTNSVLTKFKDITKITNSHYLSVFGGGLFLGTALTLWITVFMGEWINKDLITKRADLTAQIALSKKEEIEFKKQEATFKKQEAQFKQQEDEFKQQEAIYKKEAAELTKLQNTYNAEIKKLSRTDIKSFIEQQGNQLSYKCQKNYCTLTLPKSSFLQNLKAQEEDQFGYDIIKEICDQKTCYLHLKK